ncbi:MOSC domain-containing protein [Paenarthrobacter nitroguajacolicus]|uniref:MOSC domain-containing protein n=1 Tax=Paenarthrobacter nitroguajacolicus TaxID=211146 RepID=UPI002857DEFF|nr:MOSC N-terminal beta barrel domain-containing protein [Paenarthrobacter nitroguajacolicus]MDR6639494.1 uncharacterized protein YcbX [Paenarthrobacter nitroguajacolicus]
MHPPTYFEGAQETIGTVDALWRYPVKSMAGQQLALAMIDGNGMEGDRLLAIFDEETGQILTLRSAPQLLYAQATLPLKDPISLDGVDIILPNGCSIPALSAHESMSAWIGRALQIRSWEERSSQSPGLDFFDYGFELDYSASSNFGDTPKTLHVVSTATLAWVRRFGYTADERRVRPNIVLDLGPEPFREDELLGQTIRLGMVEVLCDQQTERCSLLDTAQPGLEPSVGLRDHVFSSRQGNLGIYATVQTPGQIKAGDQVLLTGTATNE